MKNVLNSIFKGIEILIAVLLGIMIILTFLNVVLRFVFNTGFVQSEELARLSFIYLVYLGGIGAMRSNRHLMIETVLCRIPHAAQKVLYVLIQVCIIWLMCILAIGSYKLLVLKMADRWVATQIPLPVIWASGVIAGVSISIIAVSNIVRMFASGLPVEELIKAQDDGEENLME